MKNFLWIGAIVVVFIGLMLWANGGSDSNLPKFELGVINSLDHVKGKAIDSTASTTGVVLMEYSDFQCPACRSYYPILREIMQEFGDRITFVYRYFPLTSIHQNAEFSARAAEAAGKQGKFWEMHDLLFEKQNEWAEIGNPYPLFESYAKLLNISVEQFKTDYGSSAVKDVVRAERMHSLKIGLEGTPSFFINGKQIQNPASLDAFKVVIRNALAGNLSATSSQP